MNLWILAGGLRAKTPVPRYLPSAAMARRALLIKLQESDLDGGFDGDIPMRFQRYEEQSVGGDREHHHDEEEDKDAGEDSGERNMDTVDRRKKRWRVIYGMCFP